MSKRGIALQRQRLVVLPMYGNLMPRIDMAGSVVGNIARLDIVSSTLSSDLDSSAFSARHLNLNYTY